MKARIVVLCILFLLSAIGGAVAQSSPHSVTLNWTASTDPGVSYSIYRAAGACPSSGVPLTASKIASGLTVDTYSDTAVSTGNTYCYYITAVLNSLESVPSNTANAVILPAPPTALTVTVK